MGPSISLIKQGNVLKACSQANLMKISSQPCVLLSDDPSLYQVDNSNQHITKRFIAFASELVCLPASVMHTGLLAPLGRWTLESKRPWLCVKGRHVTETGSGTGLLVHWVNEKFEAFLETSIQLLSWSILTVNLMGSKITLEISHH